MQISKFRPCLWYVDNAEEAVNFYVSIFKNSRIKHVARYSKEVSAVAGQPEGSVLFVMFELEGQEFLALNGRPQFTFNDSISFMVDCKDQNEVDELWEKLSAGGAKSQCGWLKDKFGLSWQIVPTILGEYITHKDPEVTSRAMQAILPMSKIDIATVKRAVEGK